MIPDIKLATQCYVMSNRQLVKTAQAGQIEIECTARYLMQTAINGKMTDGIRTTGIDLATIDQDVVRQGLDSAIALHNAVVGKTWIAAVEHCTGGDVDRALIVEGSGYLQYTLLHVDRARVFKCPANNRLVRAVGCSG